MTRGDLLRRIRISGGLVKTYRADEGITVFELMNGERVPANLVHDLIHTGSVVPQQDGLPGLGDSQVYRARNA